VRNRKLDPDTLKRAIDAADEHARCERGEQECSHNVTILARAVSQLAECLKAVPHKDECYEAIP
jgi:hypothetical protein